MHREMGGEELLKAEGFLKYSWFINFTCLISYLRLSERSFSQGRSPEPDGAILINIVGKNPTISGIFK